MQKIKRFFIPFFFLFLALSCLKERSYPTKITGKIVAIDSNQVESKNVSDVISPFREKMIKEINTVISYTPNNLVRTDGTMQSTLGNLLADLCFQKADSIYFSKTGNHADFSMLNYGGIRAGIFKGEVTNKHAFELMPFENTLVVVEMTAKKVDELAQYFYDNKRAHPLSKQVNFIIDTNGYSIKINGKELDKNKTYKVVTSNYLQSGGDRMYFFGNPVNLFESNYLMRDAIISYFKSQDTLVSQLDNRVILK